MTGGNNCPAVTEQGNRSTSIPSAPRLSQHIFCPLALQRITYHSLLCTDKSLLLHSLNGGLVFRLKNKTMYLLKITCDSCDEQSHFKQSGGTWGNQPEHRGCCVGPASTHTHAELQKSQRLMRTGRRIRIKEIPLLETRVASFF